jgi:hypothetical protein
MYLSGTYLSAYLSFWLQYLTIYLSVYQSTCPSVYCTSCLSVYLLLQIYSGPRKDGSWLRKIRWHLERMSKECLMAFESVGFPECTILACLTQIAEMPRSSQGNSMMPS